MFTGPNIVTDGLNLILDAASDQSYPGTGATWYDLSGKNNNAAIYGSPTITTLGGAKCFNLDGIGKSFVANFGSVQYTNNLTFEAWIYPAASEVVSGDRGCIIQGYAYLSWNKGNQRLSNYWYSTNNQGYHEPTLQMNRSEWHHLVAVWDASTGYLYQYINGNQENIVSTIASSGYYYSELNIGWEGDSRQFAGGIATIRVYNRALTNLEVYQTYNAQKNRFNK
jgi:hypothetical protein